MTLNDLQSALRELRASWPQAWPGLPSVVTACLQHLGHADGSPVATRVAPLLDCMRALGLQIEADGADRHTKGLEPAYHNRLHMADALLALTALLLETRKDLPSGSGAFDRDSASPIPAHAEWLAMLAMLGHDFKHDGSVNKTPGELEMRSVGLLQPLMAEHGVSAADAELVKTLILLTDPSGVPASHQKIAGRPFAVTDPDCLAVLVQEADVLASSLPGVGDSLTRQLAEEWASFDAPRAQQILTPKGRLGFLRLGAFFSSPASQRLGLEALRATQIAKLEAAMPVAIA